MKKFTAFIHVFFMHLDLSNHELAVEHENVRLRVQKSNSMTSMIHKGRSRKFCQRGFKFENCFFLYCFFLV